MTGSSPLHLAAEAVPAQKDTVKVLVREGRADIDQRVSIVHIYSYPR